MSHLVLELLPRDLKNFNVLRKLNETVNIYCAPKLS